MMLYRKLPFVAAVVVLGVLLACTFLSYHRERTELEIAEYIRDAGGTVTIRASTVWGLPIPWSSRVTAVSISFGRSININALRLFELRSLQNLQLTESNVTGLGALNTLPQLTSVDLSYSTFSTTELVRLIRNSPINQLVLEGTDLNDDVLHAIGTMSQLEHLNLRFTQVDDDALLNVVYCDSLRVLLLESATGRVISSLSSLPLETLEVVNSSLSLEVFRSVGTIPTLRHLSIIVDSTGHENGGLLDHLAGLQLRALRLSVSGVSQAALARLLSSQAELVELALSPNVIDDALLQAVSELKNLRSLDLALAPIDGNGLNKLVALSNLEELNISDTHVQEEELREWIPRMPKLRKLWVVGLEVDGARLHQAHPHLRLITSSEGGIQFW